MTYQALPTVATGDMWTAAENNTYIKNNFEETWRYDSAGDLLYCDGTNTLDFLPKGNNKEVLAIVSGNLVWKDVSNQKLFCYLQKSSSQNILNTTYTNLTWDTEVFDNNNYWSSSSSANIVLSSAGLYRFDGYLRYNNNVDGRRWAILYDGSTNMNMNARRAINTIYNSISFSYVYYASAAKTVYIRTYQDSGGGVNLLGGEFMVTYLGAI